MLAKKKAFLGEASLSYQLKRRVLFIKKNRGRKQDTAKQQTPGTRKGTRT
tara:strand:+ start:707 stop:856 length:150 start_codon:yes stop_codon:yes gene_type:complete